MSIDRGLRAFILKPYPQGEKLPLPDSKITEQGVLSTAQRPGKIHFSLKGGNFPHTLTLRVRAAPCPIQNRGTQAQLIVNQMVGTAVPYYSPEHVRKGDEGVAGLSCHEAVDLYFTGKGAFEDQPFQANTFSEINLVLPEDKKIFRKTFWVQKQSLLVQKNMLDENHNWMITSPYGDTQRESTPILGYGGLYKPDVRLEEIQPVFAVLDLLEGTTSLKLYTLQALDQEKITPPQGGFKGGSLWYFAEKLPENQQMSLATDLHRGLAKVTLEHQLTQRKVIYKSKKFDPDKLVGQEFDLLFVPALS